MSQVVDLRSWAHAGAARTTPAERRMAAIVLDVLDRSDAIAAAGDVPRVARTRLATFLDQHREGPARRAATANLLALGVLGEARDVAAAADLADVVGHEQVARIQHHCGRLLEPDHGFPITTTVVRRLVSPGLLDLLAADPATADRAAEIADSARLLALALLQQGVRRTHALPALETSAELLDVIDNGTVAEWRQLWATVAASAWSPRAERVVMLAREAGRDHLAAVLADFLAVSRVQQRDAERAAITKEVQRLVTESGVSLREFATWIGASPARLSAFASGAVAPTAEMVLRMSRTSAYLADVAAADDRQRPAATAERGVLLHVPGGRGRRAVG